MGQQHTTSHPAGVGSSSRGAGLSPPPPDRAACTAASSQRPPPAPLLQSLMLGDDFTHILRVLNTNVDGRTKIMYALTSIRGIGRRFANLACKKGEVDMKKR